MSMEILVIGLNHSTAPVEIRERITFPGDESGAVTRAMLDIEGVEEAIILSTCNRAEVLVTADNVSQAAEKLVDMIGRIHGLHADAFQGFLHVKQGTDAVRHLFRVASSLDSMVVGEPQIVGQVKEAFRRATNALTTGPILNRLMHRAFFTAKRIRTETGIGMAAVSVAYVAVELAVKILGNLKDKRVLLVGAGEMAELAARHLLNQVEEPIVVVNRTFDNAASLASELRGSAIPMNELEEALVGADVVITSTGSPEPLICARAMKTVMKQRRFRPVFLIDIAIPRDVEPVVHEVDGVYLYNIDDLQLVVQENVGERRQEAIRGEAIVVDEVAKFMDWTRSLESAPTIVALLNKLEEIRAGELGRLNGKLAEMTDDHREAVEQITRSIINKIAHDPIVFLKHTGATARSNLYLDIAQRMFKLNGPAAPTNPEKEEPLE